MLNRDANRYMAVLNPIKLVITNYPEDKEEEFDAVINPEQPELGTRKVPFPASSTSSATTSWRIRQRNFFRLAPGKEVRFRSAYFIRCDEVVKDDDGNIVELRCTYDPETRGGQNPPDGRKVKATIHWGKREARCRRGSSSLR